MTELHELTALEQWQGLQKGEIGVVELTEHYLARIERLNPTLGAFVTVTDDAARARAAEVAAQPPARRRCGACRSATKICSSGRGSRPVRLAADGRLCADGVRRLRAGARRGGRGEPGQTATPEFGLPSYTETLAGPPARNPWDLSRGSGGSSGGAAVAVAARMLPFAPGSDGGGSVRIPAAAPLPRLGGARPDD